MKPLSKTDLENYLKTLEFETHRTYDKDCNEIIHTMRQRVENCQKLQYYTAICHDQGHVIRSPIACNSPFCPECNPKLLRKIRKKLEKAIMDGTDESYRFGTMSQPSIRGKLTREEIQKIKNNGSKFWHKIKKIDKKDNQGNIFYECHCGKLFTKKENHGCCPKCNTHFEEQHKLIKTESEYEISVCECGTKYKDKLFCPKCKKDISFSEFIKKKKICRKYQCTKCNNIYSKGTKCSVCNDLKHKVHRRKLYNKLKYFMVIEEAFHFKGDKIFHYNGEERKPEWTGKYYSHDQTNVHFHWLANKHIDEKYSRKLWSEINGQNCVLRTEQIHKGKVAAYKYICKYLTKDIVRKVQYIDLELQRNKDYFEAFKGLRKYSYGGFESLIGGGLRCPYCGSENVEVLREEYYSLVPKFPEYEFKKKFRLKLNSVEDYIKENNGFVEFSNDVKRDGLVQSERLFHIHEKKIENLVCECCYSNYPEALA